ncbi:MAG: sugar phosphate isomerase/epimerase family protein [bacterium]
MRIGASTTTTRELPLHEALEVASALGYDALEIWVEHLWDQGASPDRLAADAAAHGLALTVHGPTRDLNVTAANAAIKAESQHQYLAALDAAAALRAEIVVLHPGATSSAGDDTEAFWPPLEEFFRLIAERAAALELRVGIENMERRRHEFITNLDLVVQLIRRVGHPALGLTLDVAHVLFNGDVLALEGLERAICHVHLSGSTREKVHVPLSEGVYDLRPVLAGLQRFFHGIVAIEGYVRGRAREMLAENRAVLARWIGTGAFLL